MCIQHEESFFNLPAELLIFIISIFVFGKWLSVTDLCFRTVSSYTYKSSVGQYWIFLLAIIAKKLPCDNCKYCNVRFTSQLIDIIGVKWDSDVYFKQNLILLLLLYLMFYCLCKALFSFINYIKVQYYSTQNIAAFSK